MYETNYYYHEEEDESLCFCLVIKLGDGPQVYLF